MKIGYSRVKGGALIYKCGRCDALTRNPDNHTEWHVEMFQKRRAAKKLWRENKLKKEAEGNEAG